MTEKQIMKPTLISRTAIITQYLRLSWCLIGNEQFVQAKITTKYVNFFFIYKSNKISTFCASHSVNTHTHKKSVNTRFWLAVWQGSQYYYFYESSSARQVVPLPCSTADPVELNSSCWTEWFQTSRHRLSIEFDRAEARHLKQALR